jgi:hypothetical protein
VFMPLVVGGWMMATSFFNESNIPVSALITKRSARDVPKNLCHFLNFRRLSIYVLNAKFCALIFLIGGLVN